MYQKIKIQHYFHYFQRKISAHDRAKEQFESGEWATGARWADDKPRENMDAESISLMNIGACGAFVHGLEDEFLGVCLCGVCVCVCVVCVCVCLCGVCVCVRMHI